MIINPAFDAWNILFSAFTTEITLFSPIVNTSRVINNAYSITEKMTTAFEQS